VPTTDQRQDPYGAFNFLVEIDNVTVAGFSECSGLITETAVIEYRTGDEDTTVRKLPGLRKYTVITLKRGFTQDRDLWEWRKKVLNGRTERANGSIVLLNEAREEGLRFNFREGWPSKWEGPSFSAMINGTAVETLEISHEGLVLEE